MAIKEIPILRAGATADKPAAGSEGRLFVDETLNRLEYDNGTLWNVLGGGGGNLLGTLTETARSAAFTAAVGTYYTCSGTTYAITLPSAAGVAGAIIAFLHEGTGVFTLTPAGVEVIDYRNSLALIPGDSIIIVSDGTDWRILSFYHRGWTVFTPTINAVTLNPGKGITRSELCSYRRVGPNLEINFHYRQTSAGTAGTGIYLFPLPGPAGIFIDTVRCTVGDQSNVANSATAFGAGFCHNNTTRSIAIPYGYNTTNLALLTVGDGLGAGGNRVQSTSYQLSGANIVYSFYAVVPISGW